MIKAYFVFSNVQIGTGDLKCTFLLNFHKLKKYMILNNLFLRRTLEEDVSFKSRRKKTMCVLNINQEDIFTSSFHENEEQFSVSSERQDQ